MDQLPEADEFEQLLDAEAAPAPGLGNDPEAPEADLVEQAEVVDLRQAMAHVSVDPEAPDADALEQAELVVDLDPEREP